jgi:uncharacterized membrane protein YqiK
VGHAEAEATTAEGDAEGSAVRAKGMAEADSIKARAEALAENQDAVIGQELAEHWPEIVEAAAKPFGEIDQMIVLNGAEGLSSVLAQALSQVSPASSWSGPCCTAPPPLRRCRCIGERLVGEGQGGGRR